MTTASGNCLSWDVDAVTSRVEVINAAREIADYFASAGRFADPASRYVAMAAGGEAQQLVDFSRECGSDERLSLVQALAEVAVGHDRSKPIPDDFHQAYNIDRYQQHES